MAVLNSSTSILATIDDHEIVDNFAGGAIPGQSPDAPDVYPLEPPLFIDEVNFVNKTRVCKDAMQAFHEYHPIRTEIWDTPNDVVMRGRAKFYRNITFGSDAVVLILDSRSFRDAPLPAVTNPFDASEVEVFLSGTFTADRTILGHAQVECLKNDLLDSRQDGIEWKFVIIPEPIQNFVACHTFGWMEFEITPDTRALLVTVYGEDAYSELDLLADPNGVLDRVPRVVSQFMVHPNRTTANDSP